MATVPDMEGVRIAELVAALSYAADLGLGQPMAHCMRQTVIAHDVTARELARVLKPGGRLGLCNWTPEGGQGTFFRAMGEYVPPLPPFASAPILWGTEVHVRDLFAGSRVQLEFSARSPRSPNHSLTAPQRSTSSRTSAPS